MKRNDVCKDPQHGVITMTESPEHGLIIEFQWCQSQPLPWWREWMAYFWREVVRYGWCMLLFGFLLYKSGHGPAASSAVGLFYVIAFVFCVVVSELLRREEAPPDSIQKRQDELPQRKSTTALGPLFPADLKRDRTILAWTIGIATVMLLIFFGMAGNLFAFGLLMMVASCAVTRWLLDRID